MSLKNESGLVTGRDAIIKKGTVCVIVVALFTVPLWAENSILNIMCMFMLYMAIGQMWNLLGGYSGYVSLGQQIFIGIGGYSMAVITNTYHMSLFLGLFVGGVLSAVFALVVSFPVFRMKGVYFTIGTWIIAEVLMLFFTNWPYVNYDAGMYITVSRTMGWSSIYILSAFIGLGSVLLVYVLMRTKLGLALMAMRDNESAAEAMGVEMYKTKLLVFLISAFVTGIAGAAMYITVGYVAPRSAFGISWTVAAVFIVIIGGIGTMEGPIIGAAIYVVLNQYLYNFPGISMVILGVVAIAIILIAPNGIMGTLHEKFGFEVLSPRRKVRDVK